MSKRRLLPKYVSSFLDRQGKERCRFRKTGCSTYYFQHPFGTEGFRIEYRKCLDGIPVGKGVNRAAKVRGSIDDLVMRYFQSGDFRRDAAPVTLSKNRAILEKFRKKYGHLPASNVTYEALDRIIRRAREKQADGTGGNFAAQKLRKELRRLFRFAVKLGWLSSNPIEHVDPITTKTDGFHTWSEEEIRAFQRHWPLGSKQRLAMEIMLWTGKRVGDVTSLGPQHVKDGFLVSRDSKTDKWSRIPISEDLRRAINLGERENLCFVVTSFGTAYSQKGLSQAFSKWCRDAGLSNCSAHGLRKAIARRMAESRATNSEMKAITQHSGDTELAVYTRDAAQAELAARAIELLSSKYGGSERL